MKSVPQGYIDLIKRMLPLLDQWIENEPGLPDLRFHPRGDVGIIGALKGPALDYLAASPDARRLLEWLDEQTGGEATLMQATVALELRGLMPAKPGLPPQVESLRHAQTACPYCAKPIDAASGRYGTKPSPGDLGVCIYCGGFMRYAEGLALESLDEASFQALPRENRGQLERARTLILRRYSAGGKGKVQA